MGGDWSAPVADEKSVTEPKWNRERDENTQPDRDAVPEGNSPGANVNGIVDNNSLLTSGRTETASANFGSKASSGNGIETSSQGYWVKHCAEDLRDACASDMEVSIS